MKTNPKQQTEHIKETLNQIYFDYDDDDFNDRIDLASLGFSVQYIYPKDNKKRQKIAYEQLEHVIYDDDLIDDTIEIETRRQNRIHFNRKLTIAEIDKLTTDEYLAYHKFLLDLKKEQESESLT